MTISIFGELHVRGKVFKGSIEVIAYLDLAFGKSKTVRIGMLGCFHCGNLGHHLALDFEEQFFARLQLL